jgi:hypothetical protein
MGIYMHARRGWPAFDHQGCAHHSPAHRSCDGCRTVQLGLLMKRAQLEHAGWTEQEVAGLYRFISDVWWPVVWDFLTLVHGPELSKHEAQVIKTHFMKAHMAERLLSHGPVDVRSS